MKLLDKLYEKNHLTFAIVWIVAYVVLASTADGISLDLGTMKLVTVPVLAALTALLWAWIRHADLEGFFFLRKPSVHATRMLFYLPLAIIATKKIWLGIELGATPLECALWVASMCCVGIIEELIIRGLLFRAIEEDSRMQAIVISSITFGLGHIVNLFNASGQDLVLTIGQIVFAVGVGFMLVEVMLKSGSMWPCIIFHMVNNALSTFEDEAAGLALFGTEEMAVAVAVGTGALIAVAYAIYLAKSLPDAEEAR
ncbi:MAG: CPBP family intramembrane metalloprotease [Coriobacteriaceae bacterium]|nr:CPBP family intramembrane metalloprotease [Coriobacteriaceae bacterium]